MPLLSLDMLARSAGAQCAAPIANVTVHKVSTDSRSLVPGALFVALRGSNFDGHKFVGDAIAAGAKAVLVDRQGASNRPCDVPVLVVEDTLAALQDMAHAVRMTRTGRVVGITGSNGKTTTKELVAATLLARGKVHKTSGNFNNFIGLPLTLLDWDEDAWAAVCEMGMNAPGEIDLLQRIAKPHVAVVTCVGQAHLGAPGLGSIEAIAQAKSEIFAGLQKDEVAVLAADDGPLMAATRHIEGQCRVVRFGRDVENDVQLVSCRLAADSTDVRLRVAGHDAQFCLPLVGEHNAMNAAAAAAVAWSLGLSPDDIAQNMPKVTKPRGRLQLKRHAGRDLLILDDTYNANPGSMHAALGALRQVAGTMRTQVVLGDMLELGRDARALHHQLGHDVAGAGVSQLWTLGEFATVTAAGAQEVGVAAHGFTDFDALMAALREQVRDGDCLLIKGSRGMRMERVVDALLDETTNP